MKAQDPQLLPNDWYLEKMILDGQELPLPKNDELDFVEIRFFANEITTAMCDALSVGVNYFGNSIEEIGFAFLILDLCDIQENRDYSSIYLNFFGAPSPGDPYIIDYEIIAVDDYLQLILTNEDGDQAIYNNVLLNTSSFETQEVSIYPNPVAETLFIKTNEPIEHWTIYNLQGQMVLKGEKGFGSIEVSSLTQGVYFLNLQVGEERLVEQFVKE